MGVSDPLAAPTRLVWELNENSTRYDRYVAAPSNATLHIMWTISAAVLALISVCCIVIFLGILTSKKCRSSPFNFYLMFLLIPDILYTVMCTVSCAGNAIAGHMYSTAACLWQGWYIPWGVSSNAWLNAVVAFEIRKLLRSSYVRKRYFPPTHRQVVVNSLVVYLSCGLFACVPFFGGQVPHKIQVEGGIGCMPLAYNTASTLFFWLVYVPGFVAIPVSYAIFVVWDVLRHRLLPPRGRRRLLGVYFFRVGVVYLFMWVPLLAYVPAIANPWTFFAVGLWSHFFVLVASVLSLWKPDIYRAVREFVTCQVCCNEQYWYSNEGSSSYRLNDLFNKTVWNSQQNRSQNVSSGPCDYSSSANPEFDDVLQQDESTFQFLDECLEESQPSETEHDDSRPPVHEEDG